MKVKELIKLLEDDGWIEDRQKRSHTTYKKDGVEEIITVVGELRDEVAKGTLA